MKIMGIERDTFASNFYRILQPLSKLDELGLAEVSLVNEKELGDERAINIALMSDVIVFQRPATEAWFKFIKTCRKHGKLIVSDYDDDPFNTSPLNPYYQYIGTEEVQWQWEDGTKEMLWSEEMISATGNKLFNIERNINHRDLFKLNFKKSDMVTCTTENLRQEFLKINPCVSVLPNLIDPAFFPQDIKLLKEEVRIGWQGGSSHYEDLYMVRDVIVDILKANSNVKFIYFGDMRFQGMFSQAPQSQIEWHPWVNHSTYPYKLTLLNLDIGLCPLVDNQFNRNKSAIKWMEYSMVDTITIASDIPPYKGVCDETTSILVPESKEAWTHSIQRAISDASLRTTLASQAKKEVLDNHNLNKKASLWIEAYEKLLKPEANGVPV